MYMPEPHDHAAWLEKKTKVNKEWRNKQAARKDDNHKASYINPNAKAPKLDLAKLFLSALTMCVMHSDVEPQSMADDIMGGK